MMGISLFWFIQKKLANSKKNNMTNNIPEFEIKLKTKVKASELVKIIDEKTACEVAKSCFDEGKIEWVEEFLVIALNRNNRCIGFYKISSGGISGTVADPRVICQFLLLSNASGCILAHNHPSGNLTPSASDIEITKRLKSAFEMLEINLLDHIIVTAEDCYSFSQNGDL